MAESAAERRRLGRCCASCQTSITDKGKSGYCSACRSARVKSNYIKPLIRQVADEYGPWNRA